MNNLLLHLCLLLVIIELFSIKYKRNQLNFVFSSIFAAVTAVFTAIGITSAFAATAVSLILSASVYIFGGIALSKTMSGGNFLSSSPTYQATKQTQTNPDLPIPLLYGEVKVAGNRVWQDDSTKGGIKRIVAFSDGEIEDFTDIRINDIKSNDISGIHIEKFYGTASQGLPTGLPSGVGLDQLGSLKYLAYLYIKVPKGEKIDINYNLTTVIKGRKIRVYTTPTTYEVKYSNNPAWVMFDFLTCYNGRGLCLDSNGNIDDNLIAEMFDLNSFIESAAYCDEIIEYDTNNNPIKRFTFNMIFDSQTSHRTLLDEIQRSCRGGLFTKDGKLQFKIDKAEPVSKVFTEADIIDGSETFQCIPNEENYEVLKIEYVSPDHEWQKVQAYAELPTTRTGVPIEHTVSAYSVTNFQQASRLAWYYLNSKRLCPYLGSFKTGFKAYDLEVGQVISIPVIMMGLSNYLVKVTSVINNGTGTYTVNYRTYNSLLYGDEKGCLEPTALIVNISPQYALPDDVQNFNVVQSGDLYVMSWTLNNDSDTYEIRYGDTNATWDTAEVIQKGTLINEFSYKIKQTGIKKFFIKSHNEYNYSANATVDVISVDDLPETNILVSYDVLEAPIGTHTHTKFYNGKLKLQVDNVLWHTTTDKWGEGDTYYQNGGYWGARTYTSGEYVSQVFDVGGVLLNSINFTNSWFSPDDTANVEFMWRYSEDGVNWCDWKILTIGAYSFRYSQYKIVINSPNGVQTVVTNLTVIVDVPDRFETIDVEVTDAQAGVRVQLEGYHAVPSIVATVNDNITAYAVVDDKDIDFAIIKIYDNSGTLTAGNVSLYVKGY